MGRLGKYSSTHGKEGYQNKDNTRLKVIMWLSGVGKSNQNNMMNEEHSPLKRGQKWVRLSNILDELVEWGWIEKKPSKDVKGVMMYELLDAGREIAKVVKSLEENSSVFKNLDCFDGVKLID